MKENNISLEKNNVTWEKNDISHPAHPLYTPFKELYASSFPIFEQRTEPQQLKAFSCSNYHLTAYRENDRLIGFIAYWEFPTYIYIEHFAISTALRGKGYGCEVLQRFMTENSKTILLEIDPPSDDMSIARLRFYQRCGFYSNPYPHIHPPYRSTYKGHTLVVLTSGREITEDEYRQFQTDLSSVIMQA